MSCVVDKFSEYNFSIVNVDSCMKRIQVYLLCGLQFLSTISLVTLDSCYRENI